MYAEEALRRKKRSARLGRRVLRIQNNPRGPGDLGQYKKETQEHRLKPMLHARNDGLGATVDCAKAAPGSMRALNATPKNRLLRMVFPFEAESRITRWIFTVAGPMRLDYFG